MLFLLILITIIAKKNELGKMLQKSRRSQSEIYRKTNCKFGFAGSDSGQCVPVYLMLIMSLKNTLSTYDFNLNGLTLENYVKIFRTAEFERYFFNSVFVALAGVLLAVAVSCLCRICVCKIKISRK